MNTKEMRTLTRAEFLKLLRKTPRKWVIRHDRLRCAKGDCPITAVYRLLTGIGKRVSYYDQAAEALRLRDELAMSIADAADGNDFWGAHKRLRRDLLCACGLETRT